MVTQLPCDHTRGFDRDLFGGRLAKHQVPRRWYVLAEIPRTSRGKVNRATVATQCQNETPLDVAGLRGTSP